MQGTKVWPQITLASVGALTLLLLGTGLGRAEKNIFTETYDLSQPQPCEGLDLDGVAYSFTIGGSPNVVDCTAGTSVGPLTTNDIEPPNIEGSAAGALHLKFDVPTTAFSFGVALNTSTSPQPNSVIVHLYRPGAGLLRQEVQLTATSDPNYVGGHFNYNGPAIRTATIQFANGQAFSRFAVDNVSYFRPPGQAKE
jgi:hypothetical protein